MTADEIASAPLDDVREEGLRLATAAASRELPLRLVGGVAVWARCPSAEMPALARTYGDVDVIILSSARQKVARFLEEMGYVPDKLFNAIHGAQRLNFMDPARARPLDVLVDRFVMCHTIDFRKRLLLEPLTIPLSDLLLTKLQVVELNPKDVKDIIALLVDHPLSPGPAKDTIDLSRLADVLGADWGFEHTVRQSLAKVLDHVPEYALPDTGAATVKDRVDGVLAALDAARKTLAWKARAVVGERVRWYELPEDVRH